MTGREKGPSQASQLVSLAQEGYDLVMSEDGRPYGVRRHGPNVVLPLRGKAGMRSWLARQYTEASGGQVPSQAALADAMTVLEGMAAATDPVPVHLRVAGGPEQVVLDLGTADGRCVSVSPEGWAVQERSPVLFRRSGAMSPMPTPQPDGNGLALLHDLLNMDDTAFHQLVAWLIAAWIPHIPHPVLTFKGEQGTGKSKTAQMVINLVDPSAATKRSQPRDVKTWATQAFNSWALCLDNISTIQPWLSDTLCKAVTGDGIVDRALYTDDDVVVLTFRRVLAMTTIDAGALAGDLAERLMMLDLQVILEERRRTEEALDIAFDAARPAILASLFDLLAAVLRELPHVHLERMPRMADFARVLATVDRVQGWSTLPDYLAAAQTVAVEALEADPFAAAVVTFIETHGPYNGSVTQLLDLLPPPETHTPKWPKTPAHAGALLRRFAPALRAAGIAFEEGRDNGRNRGRVVKLTPAETARKSLSAPSAPSATPAERQKHADSDDETAVRTLSVRCPQPPSADSADSTADSESKSLSAPAHAADQQKRQLADSADGADSDSHPISGLHLRCAVCGKPVDPALTAAGHLTHPQCL
ncbi:ATP-binding protein [Streptomyces griseocarneus]|uniref:ATP-binding protein n=1 Tax=Streptomyces griseocarneus TaxID=51201 RepID=UPI00167D488A|nr:ATP-binding protein [Streptomyces griseocarneus]MBZ6477519.1 virulence-associated E family protein [Streptomyces griseocarneus]GHG82721.1 ATP-binding protein [Streptomyces griseocarneus]